MFDNNRTYTARRISGLYTVYVISAYAPREEEIFSRGKKNSTLRRGYARHKASRIRSLRSDTYEIREIRSLTLIPRAPLWENLVLSRASDLTHGGELSRPHRAETLSARAVVSPANRNWKPRLGRETCALAKRIRSRCGEREKNFRSRRL